MSATPRTSPAPTPQPGPDRRAHARRQVLQDQIVPIAFDGDNGGLILDVSQHGCAVQAVGPLESGNTTQFDFVLPDSGKRLRGRGEVRWSEKSGRAGLRFLEFSRGSLADLTTWLARPSQAGQEIIRPTTAAEAPPTQQEVAKPLPVCDGDLAATAQRVREQTHASGVAIAIGPQEDMVCRASVGAAPSLGAKLQADSGLSGECVRTGVLVRCDDTESDVRVDAEVCRQLDIRSAVLVPILRGRQIAGVLEVFSNVPRAFGSQDIQRLSETAEQIRVAVFPQQQAQTAPAPPPVPAAITDEQPAAAPASAAATVPAASSTIVSVSPLPETPAPVPASLPQTVVPPKLQPVAPVRPLRPAAPVKLPPRKLTRAERSAAIAARRSEQVSAPTFTAELPAIAIPRAAKIGFASALAFAALVAGLWVGTRSRPASKPEPAGVVTGAATTPAVIPQSEPTTQPPAPPVQAKPDSKSKTSGPGAAPKAKPADPVAEVALQDIRRPQAVEAAPTPPPLTEAAIPSLPAVRAVAPSPVLHASSGLVQGKLVRRVAPEYPAAAYTAHISGDVVLNAVIRNDGSIGAVEVVSGNPVLARAAVAAVRQWRYEPYVLDGIAVEATANIRLTFKAPRAYGVR